MSFPLWLLLLGTLLVLMALANPVVERLPITPSIVYLMVGVGLGPWGLNVIHIDPFKETSWLLHATEIAVIVSLFTVGMKLRLPWRDRGLRPALCLATVSMVLTVALIAAVGVVGLNLPLGAAILLGGILAPTDPVLASEVQVQHPRDRDKIRLTLSAEAGLNDGSAFPFVFLGLGLLHLRDLGEHAWRWWVVDVVWFVAAGIAIGALVGYGLGHLLLYLQSRRKRAVAFGEYMVLGLIGVSYGTAVLVDAAGFLAVFAAGVALRAVEMKTSPPGRELPHDPTAMEGSGDKLAANPQTASAYFAGVLLATNELLEHLLAVGVVLLVGVLLASVGWAPETWWFTPLLFVLLRPVATLPIFGFGRFTPFEFGAIAWFGIRGIGSVYYLMYALEEGVPGPFNHRLASLTLSVVAASIVVHGISVTPLFRHFRAGKTRERK